LHCPSGNIPKDGPSAGITVVSALLSLATKTPIRAKLAMSGEITITGVVLPVGGIKEKLIGAQDGGAIDVILPAANEVKFRSIQSVPRGINVYFVKHYSEVFDIAFRGGMMNISLVVLFFFFHTDPHPHLFLK